MDGWMVKKERKIFSFFSKYSNIQYMVHSYFDPMMALEERFGDLFWIGSKVTEMLDIGHSPQLE